MAARVTEPLPAAHAFELEQLSDRSMPGTNRHRLGEWVLRADRGATGRANTVWPIGHPPGSISDAVDEVERWYDSLQLRAGFQMFNGSSRDLVDELDLRGYSTAPGAIVMTGGFDDLDLTDQRSPGEPRSATAMPVPSPAFLELVGDADRVLEMTSTGLPQQFVTIETRAGRTLGGGRATLDGHWMGVFAMNTIGVARRSGVALRVLTEFAEWGQSHGASHAWLQVMYDNNAARSLYSRIGMSAVHGYEYRFCRR